MKIRALALGAIVGFVAAFTPSCSPATCGPQNCDGCCDTVKKTCVKKPSNNNNTTCGGAGNACVDCAASGATCNAATSQCTTTGAGGGTGGGGGTTTCDGCRLSSATGTCVPSQNSATNAVNCGLGGGVCLACSGATPLCANGTCVAADAGAGIGDPCVADTDCNGVTLTTADGTNGITAFCKLTAVDVTVQGAVGKAYAGGYCTKRCGFEESNTASSCGLPKSDCSFFLGDIGEGDNSCFKTCTASSQCRAEYFCLNGAGAHGSGLCLPRSLLTTQSDGGLLLANIDAGPGFPGEAGAPCAAAANCQPPERGACITEAADAGYVGGACTAECTASLSDDSWCGTGGICSPAYAGDDPNGPVIRWFCDRGCGRLTDGGIVGTCRTGYVCDGTNQFASCTPNCTNSGVRCGTGKTCNATTGLCQ